MYFNARCRRGVRTIYSSRVYQYVLPRRQVSRIVRFCHRKRWTRYVSGLSSWLVLLMWVLEYRCGMITSSWLFVIVSCNGLSTSTIMILNGPLLEKSFRCGVLVFFALCVYSEVNSSQSCINRLLCAFSIIFVELCPTCYVLLNFKLVSGSDTFVELLSVALCRGENAIQNSFVIVGIVRICCSNCSHQKATVWFLNCLARDLAVMGSDSVIVVVRIEDTAGYWHNYVELLNYCVAFLLFHYPSFDLPGATIESTGIMSFNSLYWACRLGVMHVCLQLHAWRRLGARHKVQIRRGAGTSGLDHVMH